MTYVKIYLWISLIMCAVASAMSVLFQRACAHFADILRIRMLHKPKVGDFNGWLWKSMEKLSLITYGCLMCVVFCFSLCT